MAYSIDLSYILELVAGILTIIGVPYSIIISVLVMKTLSIEKECREYHKKWKEEIRDLKDELINIATKVTDQAIMGDIIFEKSRQIRKIESFVKKGCIKLWKHILLDLLKYFILAISFLFLLLSFLGPPSLPVIVIATIYAILPLFLPVHKTYEDISEEEELLRELEEIYENLLKFLKKYEEV